MILMKNILFGTSHTGGANVLVPVIRKLGDEEKYLVEVFSKGDAIKAFDRFGVDYLGFDGDINVEDLSISLSDPIPSLIVTGSDGDENGLDKPLISAGINLDVRNLAVFDFWGAYLEKFSSKDTQDLAYLPDRIAVPDEMVREAMVRKGFDERLLVVTGRPCDDSLVDLVEQYNNRTGELKEELGFDPELPLIMYASQPVSFYYTGKDYPKVGYDELSVLRQVIEARDSLDKKVNLLVKTHPAEEEDGKCKTIGKILEVIEGKNVVLKRKKEYDTNRAALASDVIVSTFSTVLIEAALLDKLALSLQPEKIGDDKMDTNAYGVTVGVYRSEDIRPILESALFDEGFKSKYATVRKELAFKPDGKATERVVDLVYDMVR